jgi:hypothetical protein
MKNQLSVTVAQFTANPNAGKIVSVVMLISFAVIGLVIPGIAAFAGPVSGEAG